MFERTAGLISWGRYYRGKGIERTMPFDRAAEEYRRLILADEADTELAETAAEFLFFSGRVGMLDELSDALLSPALVTPASLAYCAWGRSFFAPSKALALIERGRELFPNHEAYINDIIRLKSLAGDHHSPVDTAGAAESALDDFYGIVGSIYLLLFLASRGLIESLPEETESAFSMLRGRADDDQKRRDVLLLEHDYALITGDLRLQAACLESALNSFPEDYDTLLTASRFGLDRATGGGTESDDELLQTAGRAVALRPWQPDGYALCGDIVTLRAETALADGNDATAATEFAAAAEYYMQARNRDTADPGSVQQLLFTAGARYTLTDDAATADELKAEAAGLAAELTALIADDATAIASAGRTIFENGLEEEGEELIRVAALRTPDAPEVRYAQGTVLFTRAMRSAAGDAPTELLTQAAEAFRSAFEAEEDPELKSRCLVTLASVYRQLKDSSAEIAALEEGAAIGLPDEEIYLTLSELLHRLGLSARGVAALEQGFALLPDSADLGVEIARCYSRDGRFDEAFGIIDRIISLYPASPWIWNQMGIIQIERGNGSDEGSDEARDHYRRAVEAYDKARTLAPDDYTFMGNYGDALRLCGELDTAETRLKEAMKLNFDDVFSLNSLGLLYGERARQQKEREEQERWLQEAEACFQRAAMIEPSNPAFEINLADLYYDFGFFEDTIDIYQRIIETEEDAWQYYDIVGLCYYHTGHLKEAAQWFAAAMEKEPGAPEVVNSLGLCYYGSGKISEAIEFFKQASLLDPENPVYLDNIVMAQYNQKGYSADFGDGPRM